MEVLVFMDTGNLSSTLQYTQMLCYKAHEIAKVCFSKLQGMREEAIFDMFIKKVKAEFVF